MVQYINEIIRTNYKCNRKCKFCNVLKTNNYWVVDVSDWEVINKILEIARKYNEDQLKYVTISFSWWEPLMNKNLEKYIKLAKKIWIWTVEIQTNWILLINNKFKINKLYDAWLDEIFIAQHSHKNDVNYSLWCFLDTKKLEERVFYVKKNNIYTHEKNQHWVSIYLNIVITKINLPYLKEFLLYLKKIWFIDLIEPRHHFDWNWNLEKVTRKISLWFVQPHWYAWEYWKEVLLDFNDEQKRYIEELINYCEENDLLPDIHFVGPPLCLMYYPKYNLEYNRLKKIEEDKKKWLQNDENIDTFRVLQKEKSKLKECERCKYNKFCLWIYKARLEFFGEEYARKKINEFIKKQ